MWQSSVLLYRPASAVRLKIVNEGYNATALKRAPSASSPLPRLTTRHSRFFIDFWMTARSSLAYNTGPPKWRQLDIT
jgi:hypothetical protein